MDEQKHLPKGTRPDTSLPTPSEQAQDSSAELISISEHYLYSAPLPPPSVLAEYERVMPGLGERIVRMAKKSKMSDWQTIKKTSTSSNVRSGLVSPLVLQLWLHRSI